MNDPTAGSGPARAVFPATTGARPPAALAAFLRGVERRGAVLAELQCGDADAGDAALASAMSQFRQLAGDTVMDDWPRQFWALLLTQPALQTRTRVAIVLDATDRLAELGSGPRAALLLRLAAGLDEAVAAAVLGVGGSTYRLALQRGLPHQPDGRADPQAWQVLREQIHRRIKTLPPARLERLCRSREAALQGIDTAAPSHADGIRADRKLSMASARRPVWLLRLLWALLVLCVLALAATFWSPRSWWAEMTSPATGEGRALSEQPPASRYDGDTAVLTHRDFDLLADPQASAADGLAFHAWLAAQGDRLPADPAGEAMAGDEVVGSALADGVGTEASDEHE